MEDKITLDRQTFKALAIDSRVDILRRLEQHQHTLTDLAQEMGLAPSTIKEHLDKLVAVDLVVQIDKGMKWKYYRLTRKGRKLLNPHEKRVWIVLSLGLVFLFAAMHRLLVRLNELACPRMVSFHEGAPSNMWVDEGFVEEKMAGAAYDRLANVSSEVVASSSIPAGAVEVGQIPFADIVVVLVVVLIVGVCVGYLIRRKRFI